MVDYAAVNTCRDTYMAWLKGFDSCCQNQLEFLSENISLSKNKNLVLSISLLKTFSCLFAIMSYLLCSFSDSKGKCFSQILQSLLDSDCQPASQAKTWKGQGRRKARGGRKRDVTPLSHSLHLPSPLSLPRLSRFMSATQAK